jgi:hypothetical protein
MVCECTADRLISSNRGKRNSNFSRGGSAPIRIRAGNLNLRRATLCPPVPKILRESTLQFPL